jgi:hypothetical protein
MPRRKNPLAMLLVVAVPIQLTLATSSCDAPQELLPKKPVSIAPFVTGDAASSLTLQGGIGLPGPLALPYPQISEEQAVELADTFRKVHLPGILPAIEKERRAGIDPSQLHSCGRTFYAEPSVEPLPATVTPAIRRAYGPWWLVTLCGKAGSPEVSIAVSAFATDLSIRNGLLVYPPDGGEFFHPLGIPIDRSDGIPGPPEDAIAQLADRTGLRINQLPHLVFLPRTLPQRGYWRLMLEAPGEFNTTDRVTRQSEIVYYSTDAEGPHRGHRGSWLETQGDPREYEYTWIGSQAQAFRQRPTFVKSRVAARADMALKLDPVAENKQ